MTSETVAWKKTSDKKWFVYGMESGDIGYYRTKKEAMKAIREVKAQDMRLMGYTDEFVIEYED